MKKIIFDLDNTLLFLSNEWIECAQNFLCTHGVNIDAITLFKTIENYEDTTADLIVTKKDLRKYLFETLLLDVNDETFKELLKYYNNIPLINVEEIYELLSCLSQKYELIAYTNWFTNDQKERLHRYNLDIFFSKIYGWDIIPAKPSLKGIKTIIGNDETKNFIFVGDDIKLDLEIPSEIGMDTIFFNINGIEQTKYREIRKIEDLAKILDK